MIGGLAIVGLFLGLYFGLGYPESIDNEAAHGFLRCQHGWDLINGKCLDIDECNEHKGTGLNSSPNLFSSNFCRGSIYRY